MNSAATISNGRVVPTPSLRLVVYIATMPVAT